MHKYFKETYKFVLHSDSILSYWILLYLSELYYREITFKSSVLMYIYIFCAACGFSVDLFFVC